MFIGHMYDVDGAYHSRSILFLAAVAFAAAGVSLLLPRKNRVSPEVAGAILVASPVSLEE
jgi:predicted cobalt transporter CbtA